MPVGEGRDGADLTDQSRRGGTELSTVIYLHKLRVEAGEGVDHGAENGHGRRLAREAVEVVLHALVDIRLVRQLFGEIGVLLRGGQ